MAKRRRTKPRPGRNDLCSCGSGKKFKRCCGLTVAPRRDPRASLDWMATFLEDHVRPHIATLRADFQYEYLCVYESWARDDVHDRAAYDTDRCWRMVEIAESHLDKIAAGYYRRILIKALRTMPLSAMAAICMEGSTQQLVERVRDATVAAWIFGRRAPSGMCVMYDAASYLYSSEEELAGLESNLGPDMARFMGAVFARQTAERAHRLAGKGGLLKRPAPYPLPDRPQFKKDYPRLGFVLMPRPEFEEDEVLSRSVNVYESRRGSDAAVTGLLPSNKSELGAPASFWWWTVKAPEKILEPMTIRVHYKSLDKIITSHSYVALPVDAAPQVERLKPFGNEFPSHFGFDFESFLASCSALYNLTWVETGYHLLDGASEPGAARELDLTSGLSTGDPLSEKSPGHLYSLFSGAALRAPRAGFLRYLESALMAAGIPDGAEVAEKFIERFSAHATVSSELAPSLFFPVDGDLLVLDFLLMDEFFKFCLRTVTSSTGDVGNRRARLFEEESRERIKNALQLASTDIPFRPNRDLIRAGRNYGDVDFAFVWKGLLVNLDMKSWQMSTEYFKGGFHAVDNRQKELVKQLGTKVEPRGRALLDHLQEAGIQGLKGVVSFLCVANVEFLHLGTPELWYGTIPRVLTPYELIDLMGDSNRFSVLEQHGQA